MNFLKKLENFAGQAALYETSKSSTGYVAISRAQTMDRGDETMIFACDKEGKVTNWWDLYAGYGESIETAAENFKKHLNMTAQEIIKVIEDLGISVSDFAHGDFGADYHDKDSKVPYNEEDLKIVNDSELTWSDKREPRNRLEKQWRDFYGIGEWEEVHSTGGEDQGSNWTSVKYFKDHDVYICTTGYYQSHHGTDFYNGYGKEVFPKQKTITVYE